MLIDKCQRYKDHLHLNAEKQVIAAEGEQKASRALRFNSLSVLLSLSFILSQFLFHFRSVCLKFEFSFIVFHRVSPCYIQFISSSFTVYLRIEYKTIKNV